jgi:hypothetical protein
MGKFRYFSENTDLPFYFRPIKNQCSLRVFRQLTPLSALVIGEKNEPALVKALEEDHARRGLSILIGGSQRHGIGVDRFGPAKDQKRFVKAYPESSPSPARPRSTCLSKPGSELNEGIRRQIVPVQASQAVVSPQICNGHKIAGGV